MQVADGCERVQPRVMSRRTDVAAFIEELAYLRFPNVFNPYSDMCPQHDLADGACIRRANLTAVLEAALTRGVESVWIGRDLGYRGGRRTGLAFTDEVHLAQHSALLATAPLVRATKGPACSERTATVMWTALEALNRPVFLWNVFPFHPHGSDVQLSNRCHTRAERAACLPILEWLLATLRPRNVVAIGRDAHSALSELGIPAVRIRHPSHGGQAEFLTGLAGHHGVRLTPGRVGALTTLTGNSYPRGD